MSSVSEALDKTGASELARRKDDRECRIVLRGLCSVSTRAVRSGRSAAESLVLQRLKALLF